jgi:predicted CoA-substrate-specific enzyme activase
MVESALPVEVDVYRRLPGGTRVEAVLGVDVGSTSTKAVLVDIEGNVLAGFYTRTAGRPLTAVRALFEALDRMADERGTALSIAAAGTTGAGRKFTGRVLGADLIMNEITAHARAAVELNPATDTIIEIGGQDSKFTTLKGGRVTFCQMNTVCAAGTGSFIEEQAAKLGVPIGEYSRRAEGVRAPLASDRCTVFMERDINHYLNNKYSVEEILAAALYSVRENYLLKVASEALIGNAVCFQGATAKNRALVAAFERKLGKPIFVSRYCHLTGALGTALSLLDALPDRSGFRGLELFKEEIPVRSETCELCANRCRLGVAEVRGETVAYGFQCGRDYEVKRYVSRNRSGFDLLGEYERAFDDGTAAKAARGSVSDAEFPEPGTGSVAPGAVTIGIPASLHLFGELPLWKRFFEELGAATAGNSRSAAAGGGARAPGAPMPGARGIRAVTSEHLEGMLKSGKHLTGAEFCAPVTALHGHARALAESCDFVFLPYSLEAPKEERDAGRVRSYCYYTQYAPTVVSILKDGGLDAKCLTPLVQHGSLEDRGSRKVRAVRNRTKRELHRVLAEKTGLPLTPKSVSRAYDRALAYYRSSARRLAHLYLKHSGPDVDVKVVLVGRPYLVLSRSMNKGIPDLFASLGIRCFSQEMIPLASYPSAAESLREIEPLLDAFHWQFAARVLETAAACTRIEGLYPVLVTAFKCSPDSFVIEYFKRILDAGDKPYLILQLDEHDSNMGYETRIEAGVHSFRNHHRAGREAGIAAGGAKMAAWASDKAASPAGETNRRSVVPRIENSLKGRVLLFPNWDTVTSPLVVANLQGAGIDARLLQENQLAIQKGMRLNTGQCIPINVITQESVDYIRSHGLDPERVVLWMAKGDWTCGLHIYPHYIKTLLEEYGGGMEKVGVYMGDVAHAEISPLLVINTYFAYLFGGLLRRMGCMIRPYEVNEGETDRVIAESQALLIGTFRERGSKLAALRQVMGRFEAIPRAAGRRPKVAIFGDLYVRDNDAMNQGLIRLIEKAGGEVLTTPFSEYMQIIAAAHFRRYRKGRRYGELMKYKLMLALVKLAERRYAAHYRAYVSSRESFRNPAVEKDLERFHVRLEHSGESYDNVLKILHLLKVHRDIRLFVQTNPAFCCPSLVTEAMSRRIEELTGVPVVTLTYDGTGSPKNDLVLPFLKRLTEVP